MNKELEALTRVSEIQVNGSTIKESDFYSKDVAVIERALERKEKLEKVLEILKSRIYVTSFYIKTEIYYVVGLEHSVGISQEEYKLLKEILQ